MAIFVYDGAILVKTIYLILTDSLSYREHTINYIHYLLQVNLRFIQLINADSESLAAIP